MKERLLQLLDLEQISPSKFADIIGVQRSSISHVISGRNKPSYDFLQKTLKAFPGLNASWLIMGEGTMYEQMGRTVPGNLFDAPTREPEVRNPLDITDEGPSPEGILDSEPPSDPQAEEARAPKTQEPAEEADAKGISDAPQGKKADSRRKIVRVMVIYNDDTFRTFAPAE